MSHPSVRPATDTTTNSTTNTTADRPAPSPAAARPSTPDPTPAEASAVDLEAGNAHAGEAANGLGPSPRLGGSLPLDVAEHAFALLMRGPHPLSVDGAALGHGLPALPIPLSELRVMLLHPSCSRTTRDHIWRHLIDQARSERGAWMVAAVALALPMLRRLIAALADKTPAERIDREDLEAEVLTAYMHALTRVNLTWSHPLLRLSRLTQFAVLRALAAEPPSLVADPDLTDQAESRQQTLAYPAGHPDLLLAQAVAEGVITEAEAELIGFTRLEGIPLSTYCRRRGLLYCTALKRRQRAENALYQVFLRCGL
ncbi:hypothetical protein [Nonomuraea sp. bgisy101]|uniref:hypothetical protein n=1 Tax=Nonomuraea sp. bgisy101 TaxID=3413784 RepID=UPI003D72B353